MSMVGWSFCGAHLVMHSLIPTSAGSLPPATTGKIEAVQTNADAPLPHGDGESLNVPKSYKQAAGLACPAAVIGFVLQEFLRTLLPLRVGFAWAQDLARRSRSWARPLHRSQ